MTAPELTTPMLFSAVPDFPRAAAPFIKEVGRGHRGAKDLTREQAREAMGHALDGRATPSQIGALFQAYRIKSESPDELAGMIDAVRERSVTLPGGLRADRVEIGVPYDGRLRAFHSLPFAARLAARSGLQVFFHGDVGVGPKFGVSVCEVLHATGVTGAVASGGAGSSEAAINAAEGALERDGVAFALQGAYSPATRGLRSLRDEVILRGPLATVEKMINLSGAGTVIAGNFHTPYAMIMAGAFAALRETGAIASAWVVQGPEGHVDIDPRRPMSAQHVSGAGITQVTLDAAPRDTPAAKDTLVPPAPPEADPADAESRRAWIAANVAWGEGVLSGAEERGAETVVRTTAMILLAAGRSADWASAVSAASDLLARERSR